MGQNAANRVALLYDEIQTVQILVVFFFLNELKQGFLIYYLNEI